MFFIASKLLSFLLTPLVWSLGMLLLSWKTNDLKRKKRLFFSSIILLYFFSNELLTDITTGKWEYRYEDKLYCPENDGPYEYGIVLGGMTWYNSNTHKPQFLRSGDRLFQAVWLLKQKHIKKILFSGGSGSLTSPDIKEGIHIRHWLNQIGIPDSLLIIEAKSDNTHENASFTKHVLDSLGNNTYSKALLITSAAHMRRSLACFRKEGFKNIVPYPKDYYSSEFRIEFYHCLLPSTDALYANNVFIHEIVGYVIYKLMGYC